MSYLTLFTIGPVQGFIAQARKLQDLYAGSFLLSYLSKKAMNKAAPNPIPEQNKAEILFPDKDKNAAPNRFLMLVKAEDEAEWQSFCAGLAQYVKQEWVNIAKSVFKEKNLNYSDTVSAQIESVLQVYYAAEEYPKKGFGSETFADCYIKVIKRLGSAKIFRDFNQLNELGGRKCSIMHEYNALFYRKKSSFITPDAQEVTAENTAGLDKYIKPGEALCAVSLVKRCLKSAIPAFDDDFPSVTDIYEMYGSKYNEDDDKHGYYAVIKFDGDDMGMWYSQPEKKGINPEKIEAFQRYLSGEISTFADTHSRGIVNWNKTDKAKGTGVVIYAGGEDFLGVFNLENVFALLKKLREVFGSINLTEYYENANEADNKTLTFSAGVVIAHVKTPLSQVRKMAEKAEEKAKGYNNKQKDAFCLTIAKHSGEVTDFIQPFYYDDNSSSLEVLESLVGIIVKTGLSVKFIYQLGQELERLAETENNSLHKEIFLSEAKRIVSHSEFTSAEKRKTIVADVMRILEKLTNNSGFNLKNLLMYLRAIAFIARERSAIE
ncbi:MAG: type III-B CRISPR-associated protein Cas10/Cmr2 [Clostridiales bacterium]|jgi:CRISPR-associated protein Cmr2|nr:type III-B CRISPR-associated protein Cas10/Cmr2 [Clostridiales bacterium]